MVKSEKKYIYPSLFTETFDDANFHIKYCLSFIKKYLIGNIAEIGAGCGSFTRHFLDEKITSLTLTEKDEKNVEILKSKYSDNKTVTVTRDSIFKINNKFDVVLYLHVLEHIKNDENEIKEAMQKIKNDGFLIIMVPAHQKIYSNLDRNVGHFRRYEKEFFDKNFQSLQKIDFKYLDSAGYILYKLNKLFFKKEQYPSKLKIFIWDKLFTPLSALLDFLLRYKFGKCILAIYKKV